MFPYPLPWNHNNDWLHKLLFPMQHQSQPQPQPQPHQHQADYPNHYPLQVHKSEPDHKQDTEPELKIDDTFLQGQAEEVAARQYALNELREKCSQGQVNRIRDLKEDWKNGRRWG